MHKLVLLVMCTSLIQQAFGWGNEGHMAVNRAAARGIPSSMPAFLRNETARIEYLGSEPDRWRGRDEPSLRNAQEPDHFINLERLGWMKSLPRGRYAFYRALYERRAELNNSGTARTRPDDLLPERVGLQPYAATEVYERLKAAFREYRQLKASRRSTRGVEQNIVFYMGWMAHYVADGANPLHTTVHYNGWSGPNPSQYTTERRIHWMMEGPFVTANPSLLSFADLVRQPARLADPWSDYYSYLKSAHGLVERCYELEKSGGFIGAGTAQSRGFIRQRLAAAAQMLLNMWYTAWVESQEAVAVDRRDRGLDDVAHPRR